MCVYICMCVVDFSIRADSSAKVNTQSERYKFSSSKVTHKHLALVRFASHTHWLDYLCLNYKTTLQKISGVFHSSQKCHVHVILFVIIPMNSVPPKWSVRSILSNRRIKQQGIKSLLLIINLWSHRLLHRSICVKITIIYFT